MKRLFLILALLACIHASAVEQVEGFITITNGPVTGDAIIINGVTRTWTNAHSSTTVLTNLVPLSVNTSATNLYFNLSAYTIAAPQPVVIHSATNKLRIVFDVGQSVTLSQVGTWAEITYTTNTITTAYAVRVPITIEATTNRTNIASLLVSALQHSTNAIAYHWVVGSQFAGLTNNNAFTGTNSMADGGWNRPRLTNVVALSGVVTALTNGYWTNAVMDKPTATNMTVYGGFSVPGSGNGSLNIGDAALASGADSISFGNLSSASDRDDIAIGNLASASGGSSFAAGTGASTVGTNTVAFGAYAIALAPGSMSLGAYVDVATGHTNSIGIGADTTETNQIMIGAATHKVRVPGVLQVTGTQASTIFDGTNKFNMSVGFTRTNNTTLANGPNLVDPGLKTYIRVSGPSAAYSIDKISGGWDGRFIRIQKNDSYTLTIPNESGSGGGTDADRARTGTGATVTITNNPAVVEFTYDIDLARWVLGYHSN